MNKAQIGIIGGTGLYEIDGVKVIEEVEIETPWGAPSSTITIGELGGRTVAFLARHGKGHVYLPHEVNSRANIAALKMLGVNEIIAISASGSLKEEIRPLDFVIPDQVIDRTRARPGSFFGNGIAGHIGFAEPFCSRLHGLIIPAAQKAGVTLHQNQTLLCMEGPAFSSKAESNLYRSWGCGVINMSTLPEAKLAREAEICYAVICMSTDYDCWHEEEEVVTIDMVIQNLQTNSEHARNLLKNLIQSMDGKRGCACVDASKNAIVTAPDKRNSEQAKKLKTILPEYF